MSDTEYSPGNKKNDNNKCDSALILFKNRVHAQFVL